MSRKTRRTVPRNLVDDIAAKTSNIDCEDISDIIKGKILDLFYLLQPQRNVKLNYLAKCKVINQTNTTGKTKDSFKNMMSYIGDIKNKKGYGLLAAVISLGGTYYIRCKTSNDIKSSIQEINEHTDVKIGKIISILEDYGEKKNEDHKQSFKTQIDDKESWSSYFYRGVITSSSYTKDGFNYVKNQTTSNAKYYSVTGYESVKKYAIKFYKWYNSENDK